MQIGDHNVAVMQGELEGFRLAVETYTRPGVDGVGAQLIGERSEPLRIRTIADAATLEAADALYDSYLADVGSVVDITDAAGIVHTSYLILAVQRERLQTQGLIVGGLSGGTVKLAVVWTVQAVGDPTV